jgi:hypothetical protein
MLNTVIFVDSQVIVVSTEDEMQRAVYALNSVVVNIL